MANSSARVDLSRMIMKHAIDRLKPGESRRLASGKIITYPGYYADLRLLTTMPEALELITEIAVMLLPSDTRYIGAVPTGGMTMLGALGLVTKHFVTPLQNPVLLFYVRKEKKAHGQGKQVEGHLGPTGSAVMLEDVVTSGGSLIDAIQAARAETGANITTAICVLDREMGGKEALAAIGVELRPIFTATQLGLKT